MNEQEPKEGTRTPRMKQVSVKTVLLRMKKDILYFESMASLLFESGALREGFRHSIRAQEKRAAYRALKKAWKERKIESK